MKPHLPPHELARRQRWVAVGATILGFLIVATWLVSLPGRLPLLAPSKMWDSILGRSSMQESKYIDPKILGDDSENQLNAVINQIQTYHDAQITASTTASTTTPTTSATSTKNSNAATLELLKKKLK